MPGLVGPPRLTTPPYLPWPKQINYTMLAAGDNAPSGRKLITAYASSLDEWPHGSPCRKMQWPHAAMHHSPTSQCERGRPPCANQLWVMQRAAVVCALGEGWFSRARRTAKMLLRAAKETGSRVDFGPVAIGTDDTSCNESALAYSRGFGAYTQHSSRSHDGRDPTTCREVVIPDWVYEDWAEAGIGRFDSTVHAIRRAATNSLWQVRGCMGGDVGGCWVVWRPPQGSEPHTHDSTHPIPCIVSRPYSASHSMHAISHLSSHDRVRHPISRSSLTSRIPPHIPSRIPFHLTPHPTSRIPSHPISYMTPVHLPSQNPVSPRIPSSSSADEPYF